MDDARVGVRNASTALVSDSDYPEIASQLVAGAQRHCVSSVFIVDPDPIEHDWYLVDRLLQLLAGAAWRGVDTRLLIGGSRRNPQIRDACVLARERAQSLDVPTRLLAATEQRSDHAKIMVADDHVLLGSHNWSPGAFGGQTQDSLLIDSAPLAASLISRFEQRWSIGREEGFDVAL